MSDATSHQPESSPPQSRKPSRAKEHAGAFARQAFGSKLMKFAIFVTVIGAGLWVYSLATPPASTGGGATMPGMSSLTGGDATPAEDRLIDASAPATFRFGFSFVVGFFLGWATRQFLKVTLLIAGAIGAATIGMQKLGWIDLDWSAMQQHVDHSIAWMKGEAEAFKTFVMGYLPSSAAGATGIFAGLRRKSPVG